MPQRAAPDAARRDARQQPRRTQLRVDPTPSALVPPARLLRQPGPLPDAAGAAPAAHHHGQERRRGRRAAPPPDATPAVGDRARPRAARTAHPTALDAYQFVFESPHVAVDDDRARLRRAVVRRGPAAARGRARPHAPHPPRVRLRPDAPPRWPRRWPTCCASGAASARTSRTSRSPACARWGSPARYVSGYILTVAAARQAPRLVGADASHAWLAVWLGDAGWVDVDPTNDQLPSDQHITLAWGRDYADVSPLRGVVLGGGEHRGRPSPST